MFFWFRTDASLEIGSGHVMRCLTLADTLRDYGGECHFVCRAHEGNLSNLIRAHGHSLHLLPICDIELGNLETKGTSFVYEKWLGTNWESDAADTLAEIGESKVDWLIIDHYALDANWEKCLRPKCKKIMVIDDLANRVHDCNLLLDQNLIAHLNQRYFDKVPSYCHLMLGPEYALLKSDYSLLHDRAPYRQGPVRRILIYFGGADNNLTSMAVSSVLSLQRSDLIIDVVINPDSINASVLREQVLEHKNIILHTRLPSLAPLMLKADLAIGASGATSWERCCLGLPALVISVAENQVPIASELDKLGIIRWLGDISKVSKEEIAKGLDEIINSGLPVSWSEQCSQIVDGHGTERVRAFLMLNSSSQVQARLATFQDKLLIQRWTSAIESDKEISRFIRGLRDLDGCYAYILETKDGLPLGHVRFEQCGSEWQICRIVDPYANELKLDSVILLTAMHAFRKDRLDVIAFTPTNSFTKPDYVSNVLIDYEADKSKALSIAICSDTNSWINESVSELVLKWLDAGHAVAWGHAADSLPGGDICFYLSYGRIVDIKTRTRYKHNLVVHASDLPRGRGWSPASWLILEGAQRIPVTMIGAVDQVDAGPIYLQEWIELEGTEIIDDWRELLAKKTVALVSTFVTEFPKILETARDQIGQPSTYPRRRAKDSRLNPDKTIAEQMNLMRIVDNDEYPAFFGYKGNEFVLLISRR